MDNLVKIFSDLFYGINENRFISALSSWQFLCSIILIIGTIISILISLSLFFDKTKKQINNTLDIFRENGKYIDGLFVEMDNKKELLRYYVFGNRLKKKLIEEYNKFVSNWYFKDIGKNLKYKFSIGFVHSKKAIINKLETNKRVIKENSPKKNSNNLNFEFYVSKLEYSHSEVFDEATQKLKIIDEKSVIIIGDAGNGKTTLLCNIAQTSINNRIPCLYINSRDVRKSLKEYFLTTLPICNHLTKNDAKLFLNVFNIFLFLAKKHFIVIVDALNENDNELFINSIEDFNNYLQKFSRIKVIYSCRSEYYNIRSEKYFPCKILKPYELRIDDCHQNERACRKIFNVYRNYFNYTGNIRDDSKQKMLKSLLLMRMFFEVNKGSNNDTLQLYNHNVFFDYINKVNEATPNIKLSDILDKISDVMIDNKQYDQISVESIDYSLLNLNQLLDNNLILSKRIITNEGEIHQHEITNIYFTFDEIRDYYLSRRIISRCDENNSFDFLFETCDYLFENKISAIEGVLKYSYFHLISKNETQVAKELLYKYYNYSNNDIYYEYSRKMDYPILGLNIVIECEREYFFDFEKHFIFACMNEHFGCFIKLFNNLLYNEINDYKPNLDIFIEGLIHSDTNVNKIINYFKEEYVDEDYYINSKHDRFQKLENYLDENLSIIYENNNLVSLFVLLSVLIPDYDYFFFKSVENQRSRELLNTFIVTCQNEQLKDMLEHLKSNIEEYDISISENISPIFNEMLINFGGEDELYN